MKETCGNCKYCKRDFSKPQDKDYAKFCCSNEDSYNCGVPIMFDDSCEDFKESE